MKMWQFKMRPKTFLLTILLVSITPINFIISQNTSCPVLLSETTQCSCSIDKLYFDIKCSTSVGHSHITLEVSREFDVVTITCNSNDVNIYKLMPPMKLDNEWPVIYVTFDSCPLPSEPFSQLFEQLFKNVKILKFENEHVGVNLTGQHLSGLNDLTGLHINSPQLTMTEDSFKDVTKLEELDLQSNMNELSPTIFAGLKNLYTLYLNLNVTELPSSVFSDLKNMGALSLHLNNVQLTNINKEMFEGASSLTHLTIISQGIKFLQSDIFSLLTRLRVLQLNFNQFLELPSELFTNNKQISYVYLHLNRTSLKTFPPGLFANLSDLREVNIECGLNEFYTYDVQRAVDFKSKNLWVRITCGISEIPGNLFYNSSLIKDLILIKNELETLPAEILFNQYELEYLDLSFNKLKSLPAELFRDTIELKFLKLSHNQLATFCFFQTFQKLEVLKVRNNSLSSFFNKWIELKSLRELDLGNNSITHIDFSKDVIPFTLNRDNELSIDLIYNKIRTINATGIEHLRYLPFKVSVDLNENPINCDCKLLPFITYLHGMGYAEFNFTTDNLMCHKPDNLRGVRVWNIEEKELICQLGPGICPNGCNCLEYTYMSLLILNCSNNNLTAVPNFPWVGPLTFKTIELHIENNNIYKLPAVTVSGYKYITQIYAARNSIFEIDADNLPVNLTQIDLSHNNLKRINAEVINFLNRNSSFNKISLSGNPWICDCETKPFMHFVQQRQAIITDVLELYCTGIENPKKIIILTDNDVCPQSVLIAVLVSLSIVGFLAALVVVFYHRYRTEIKVLMYKHRICLCLINEEELDEDKQFDAFVSYSHKDQQFIAEQLVPGLENDSNGFKLCVDVRDFIVGEYISDQIISAIDNSRRTIVVLSQNFIESVWARQEFRIAHQASLSEGRIRVIVIIYGDFDDSDSLDLELKAYLKTNIYLKWGDPLFWDKLRYAMPHR